MVLRESYDPGPGALDTARTAALGVAIWAPDGSGTVELARLAGPACGQMMAPVHLLGRASAGQPWDLDCAEVKIRLYELVLTSGGAFDIYRYVNLGELLRLWHRLHLPVPICETWERAFRQAGLEWHLTQDEDEQGTGALAG